MIFNIENNILFSINGIEGTLLEFRSNGDVVYNFKGEIITVKDKDGILEAFKYCILVLYGEEPDKILFDKVLEKIDNGEISEIQFKEIKKRIRKTKLENIKKLKTI